MKELANKFWVALKKRANIRFARRILMLSLVTKVVRPGEPEE